MQSDSSSSPNSISSGSSTPDQSAVYQKYQLEWNQFGFGLEELRRRALTGALRASRLRSISWAIMLEVIPSPPEYWIEVIRTNRLYYQELKDRLMCDPHRDSADDDNPLSQNEKSKWNQHFRNSELQSIIKMDVVRTFPGLDFFKQPDIQQAMCNVLFCFACEAPQLLYCQGMHEILAPLLFVLQSDHRAAEHTILDKQLSEIMDPQYIEHDSFAMFRMIMNGIEGFYKVTRKSLPPKPITDKERANPKINTKDKRKSVTTVEVVVILEEIRQELLMKFDPELALRMESNNCQLSLFGLRWLRVLFGREFPLHDLLILWDAIFAENDDFSLVRYIMVAMLMAIRDLLLNEEQMKCLTYLMHYPTTIDVQYIIEHALYMKHPDQYCKPAVRTFPIPKQQPAELKGLPPSGLIKDRSDPNVRATLGEEEESCIIKGLNFKDPQVIRCQLFFAHRVMSTCAYELENYETILSDSILIQSYKQREALDSIRNLISTLKLHSFLHTEPHGSQVVENAVEANESPRAKPTRTKPKYPQKFLNLKDIASSSTREVQLKVFNMVESDKAVDGAPSLDPLGLHKD